MQGNLTVSGCDELTQRFIQLSQFAAGTNLDHLYNQFMGTTNSAPLWNALDAIANQRKELTDIFKEKTTDVLLKWYRDPNTHRRPDIAVVSDSEYLIRFLESNRVELISPIELGKNCTYFPSLIQSIRGGLLVDSQNENIAGIDFLEAVQGELRADWSKIISMKRLKVIRGDAHFRGSKIAELPSLEIVEGLTFDLAATKDLKELPSLRYVYGMLRMGNSNVVALPALTTVDGGISAEGCILASLLKLKSVRGVCNLSATSVTELPELETVDGTLSVQNCRAFTCAPKLRRVNGSVNLGLTNIQNFKDAFPSFAIAEGSVRVTNETLAQNVLDLKTSGAIKIGALLLGDKIIARP